MTSAQPPLLRVVPLRREHRALLKEFRNEHAPLVEYLQRFALLHAEQDLLARTYLAIDHEQERDRLAGYFTLATASIERSTVSVLPALARLPRFPIPGALLARLAVDERVRGQGLGRYLFEEALGLTLQLARQGPLTFRLFVTDARDQRAAAFYEHFGLVRLSPEAPCRMVLDLKALLTAVDP